MRGGLCIIPRDLLRLMFALEKRCGVVALFVHFVVVFFLKISSLLIFFHYSGPIDEKERVNEKSFVMLFVMCIL